MGGRAGRFVCIFVPMVLTIMSLIFLIMIGLGGTNAKNNYLSNLYFLRANTTGATGNSDFINNAANANTDGGDKTSDGKIIIQNYYTVALWNYCAGNGGNTTRSVLSLGQSTATTVDFCTGRKLQFAFDPKEAWGLSDDTAKTMFGEDFSTVLDNYNNKWSKWISTLYILTVTAVCLEILIGIGGLFSRLGSLFTTLSSLVTTALAFAFALLTTLTYTGMALSGTVALKSQGISLYIGPTMYVYMWLSVACSMVAGLFWAFSSCCCSGRSRHNDGAVAKQMAEPTPYTYERVTDAPYGAAQTVQANRPMNQENYDAFRHGQ